VVSIGRWQGGFPITRCGPKLRGRRFDGGGDEDWYCCLIGRQRGRRALVAFVLSRIVGRFGFSERGWVPAPHAAISVGAEVLTIPLWAAYLLSRRGAADR
jgi:hypothetical protein